MSYILSLTMNLFKSLFILIIFLIASCKTQTQQQSWFRDDAEITILNGKVKQILVINEPKDKYFYLGRFDDKGDLKYTIRHFELEWDDKDGKHSEINTDTLEYSSVYDDAGKKIATTLRSPKDTSVDKWAFDDNGKVISFRKNITETSSLNCMDYYKYDAHGDLSEYEQHFCKLMCPELYRYKYDENHLLVELSFYEVCDGFEALIRSTRFEYKAFDVHKNWIKRVAHVKGGRNQSSSTEVRKITYY